MFSVKKFVSVWFVVAVVLMKLCLPTLDFNDDINHNLIFIQADSDLKLS